jgi:hypothetical protein
MDGLYDMHTNTHCAQGAVATSSLQPKTRQTLDEYKMLMMGGEWPQRQLLE